MMSNDTAIPTDSNGADAAHGAILLVPTVEESSLRHQQHDEAGNYPQSHRRTGNSTTTTEQTLHNNVLQEEEDRGLEGSVVLQTQPQQQVVVMESHDGQQQQQQGGKIEANEQQSHQEHISNDINRDTVEYQMSTRIRNKPDMIRNNDNDHNGLTTRISNTSTIISSSTDDVDIQFHKDKNGSLLSTSSSVLLGREATNTIHNTMSVNDDDDDNNNSRPGVFYVTGRQLQQAQQYSSSHQDPSISDHEENSGLIIMVPIHAEVFDEEAKQRELDQIKAEAMESGRQQALLEIQQQQKAELVPIEEEDDEKYKQQQQQKQGNKSTNKGHFTKFILVGIIVISVILIVVPVTMIRIWDRSSTNKCFTSSTTLMNAVDAYLQSPTNNTVIGLYGYPIGTWCVSYITLFDNLFDGNRNPNAMAFDEDLSNWDVSRALSMTNMFASTKHFSGKGLNRWNISNVQNITGMFDGASSFNSNLSSWQVGHIQSMRYLFRGTNQFLGIGLDQWDTSNVIDMTGMFQDASNFDANVSKWNTSRVLFMSALFGRAFSFRGTGINRWDLSNVIHIGRMFSQATSFNANLSHWNVSKVFNLDGTFADASSFSGIGIDVWDVSRVKVMAFSFKGATNFDANLSSWNVSSVEVMLSAFQLTNRFRGIGLELWNVSNTIDMFAMFADAHAFNADLSQWDVSRVVNTSLMFANATNYRGIGLSNWNVSNVRRMDFMFFSSAVQADLSGWDVAQVSGMLVMFALTPYYNGSGLETWNTSRVENMEGMFLKASMMDTDLSGWDVSNVAFMDNMFHGCSSFQGRGLDRWNVTRVHTMKGMFQDTPQFDANLTVWDVSTITSMNSMFYQARKFQGLGLEKWDVGLVNDMTGMFFEADVFDANLSTWNVSQVSSMNYMFYDALSFRGIGLEHWDVSRVQDGMVGIFHGSTSLLDVDSLTKNWTFGKNDTNAKTWFSNATTFSGLNPQYPIPQPGRQKGQGPSQGQGPPQ